jgi:CheY-like chemotaxis protein
MKVLVVDDNELFLQVSEAALSASGFDVVTSGSALGFSTALAEARPHVALIDVLMPAINGNHLVEIARRRHKRRGPSAAATMPADDAPECLFILHSNLPETDLQTLAERCGAQGYIRKSSRPGALGEQLCSFLRQRGLAPPGDRMLSTRRPGSR